METPSHKDKDTVIIEERITKVNGDFHIKKWARGKLLGRGGFAKVYNFTNLENGKIMAGKIMPKANLNRSRSKQKLMTEIRLHKSLSHPNIVKFEHVFEDQENVYIMLELCHNQSMSELLKRRKRLIEFEVQCYLIQLIDCLKYLHANRIIHRDLKLGNMFLNDKMQIKVGDFGLAAKLEFDGEKKRTVCGTPNYIAPEIIDGNIGHSYEVDIWAVGVIIYTLIAGKPPFETTDIKLTYKKIKENDYSFPDHVSMSDNAKDLIKRILVTNPEKRLTLDEILLHPFIDHGGPIPKLLPTSTMTCPPTSSYLKQFASSNNSQRIRISTEPDAYDNFEMLKQPQFINTARSGYAPKTPSGNEIRKIDFFATTPKTPKLEGLGSARFNPLAVIAHDKAQQIFPLPLQTPTRKSLLNAENIQEDPEEYAKPSPEKLKLKTKENDHHGIITDVRVIKWYDYSSKYGLGYVLSTGAVGVSFNDGSKLIAPPGEMFTYIERKPSDKTEVVKTYKFKEYPEEIHKRVLVYNKFKENFEAAIKSTTKHDDSFVYVKKWLKTKHAILFRMNNKVLQVIFNDGTVLIMNSNIRKLTFVDFKGHTHFCPLDEASSSDNKELTKRLKYAEDVLKQVWAVQTDKEPQKPVKEDITDESQKEIHGIDLNKVIIGIPQCISPRLSTTSSTKDTS